MGFERLGKTRYPNYGLNCIIALYFVIAKYIWIYRDIKIMLLDVKMAVS